MNDTELTDSSDSLQTKIPIPKRKWTEEEIVFLKKHYVRKGRKFVADNLGRSTTGVAGMARILGLKREDHRNWSPFEDNYIRRNFGKKVARSISRSLHRSIDAVHARAAKLGLSKERERDYTAEERAFIKQLYERGVSATKIAEQMGRPESSIRTRINRWGLKSSRPWSKREANFLKKHFFSMKLKELANELGRTAMSVSHYASRHGLRKVRSADSVGQEQNLFMP